MTRKHFQAIANIFAWRKDSVNSTIDFDRGFEYARERLAEDMADYLATQTPNFDRRRFLDACGL